MIHFTWESLAGFYFLLAGFFSRVFTPCPFLLYTLYVWPYVHPHPMLLLHSAFAHNMCGRNYMYIHLTTSKYQLAYVRSYCIYLLLTVFLSLPVSWRWPTQLLIFSFTLTPANTFIIARNSLHVTNRPLTSPNHRKLLREYFTSNRFLELPLN